MIRRSSSELMRRLERYGMKFRSFCLTHEGDYSVDDADWNYKDVPHLQYVHNLVEAVFGVVDDQHIATINLQKVLGVRIALTVYNYESARNEQTYFMSFLFFVLIIRAQYEALGDVRCRVTTTYSFGAPAWLIWLFPLVRWVLKRNYADLMSGDIPMRERRGQLRKWGATFKKPAEAHSFRETMDLLTSHVSFPPDADSEALDASWDVDLPAADGEVLLGRSDHRGLRVVVRDDGVFGFPRLCDHQGACLDHAKLADGAVTCPWHARRIRPLFSLSRINVGDVATFQAGNTSMIVRIIAPSKMLVEPKTIESAQTS